MLVNCHFDHSIDKKFIFQSNKGLFSLCVNLIEYTYDKNEQRGVNVETAVVTLHISVNLPLGAPKPSMRLCVSVFVCVCMCMCVNVCA